MTKVIINHWYIFIEHIFTFHAHNRCIHTHIYLVYNGYIPIFYFFYFQMFNILLDPKQVLPLLFYNVCGS